MVLIIANSDKKIKRRSLPKIDMLLEWELVKPVDIFIAKGKEDEATLLTNGNVNVNGVENPCKSG